jgi:predicted component of type VI protein secretion system
MRARHEIRRNGEATLRTLVIGRSPSADVVIADASLAPHHAELVITDDGRLYLTDCATDGGTWVMGELETAAGWQPVRQGFVRPDQPLRLGDHQCTAGDLLRRSRDAPADAPAGAGGWDAAPHRRMRGPVIRDPATGEIVRRRP